MKGTEHFKDIIQNYLKTRASYDELFAESFRKENKNLPLETHGTDWEEEQFRRRMQRKKRKQRKL